MKLCAAFFIFYSLTALAQDLRSTATSELAAPPKSSRASKTADTNYLTTEQTSLILKLEDTYQEPKLREFQWSLGFFLQSHSPQGQITENSNNEDLGKTGTTVLPSISFGPLYNLVDGRAGALQLGLEGEAGFTSQKVTMVNANDNDVEARLDTSMTELRGLARWGSTFGGGWHARAGYGVGRMSYNQTSGSSFARWNKSGGYTDLLLGVDYKLDRRWVALAQVKRVFPRADWPGGIETPSSPIEVGAQILW